MLDPALGRRTYSEEFGTALHTTVLHSGTSLPTQVSFVQVAFGDGVFALTLTCVQAGHAYAIFDSLTVAMAGPFPDSQPLDARHILESHAPYYAIDDLVEYVDENGVATTGVVPIGQSEFPENSQFAPSIGCYGCILCVVAVTASCGILCGADPSWDTPGEGFGMCMVKCSLHALGMPLTMLGIVQGKQEITGAGVAMTVCDIACASCGREVLQWLRKWLTGPVYGGYLRPQPAWHPRPNPISSTQAANWTRFIIKHC